MESINLAKNVSDTASAVKATPKRDLKPLLHVEKALQMLRQAKIPVNNSTADNPIVKTMIELMPLGETEVVAITRTLAQAENFNTMVAEQAGNIKIGDRHLKIAESFNSVREDATSMAKASQKPKLSGKDKVQHWYMTKRRGTIHDRFERISKEAKTVLKETQAQLDLEKAVTESYKELRLALKESTILAGDLRERAREKLEAAKAVLVNATAQLDAFIESGSTDTHTRDHLELDRDEAFNALRRADQVFQTAEDVYNNLQTSYYAGEVVLTRLAQTTDAKDRVQRQTQMFFSSASTVMSGLATTLTANQGLNQATRTLMELKHGMGASMDALANVGSDVQKMALQEGYSSGMPIEPIQRLLQSIITYQTESAQIIADARKLSAENAEKIKAEVEVGRRNLIDLVQRQALETTVPDALPSAKPVAALGHELGISDDAGLKAAEATLAELRQAQKESVRA